MRMKCVVRDLLRIGGACLMGGACLIGEAHAKGQCGPVVGECDLYSDQEFHRGVEIGESLLLAGETLNDDAIGIVQNCGALPEARFRGIGGDLDSSLSIFSQTVSSHSDGKGNSIVALAGMSEYGTPKVVFLRVEDTDSPEVLGTYSASGEQSVSAYEAAAVGASGAFLSDGKFLMVHPVQNGAEAPAAKLLAIAENGQISVQESIRFPSDAAGETKPLACAAMGPDGVICSGRQNILGVRLNASGQLETWQSNAIPNYIEAQGQYSTHILVNGAHAYIQRTMRSTFGAQASIVYSLEVTDPVRPRLQTFNYVTSSNRPITQRPFANLVLAEREGTQYLIAAAPGGDMGVERLTKYLTFRVQSPRGDLWTGPNGLGGSTGLAFEVGEGWLYGRPVGILGDALISYQFGRLTAHDLSNPEVIGGVMPVLGRMANRGCRMFEPGDLNCDARVDNADIDPFVLALVDPYELNHSSQDFCTFHLADFNLNGRNDSFDIDLFINRLMRNP